MTRILKSKYTHFMLIPLLLLSFTLVIYTNVFAISNELPEPEPDHSHEHSHQPNHIHLSTDCEITKATIDAAEIEASSIYRAAQYDWVMNHQNIGKPHRHYVFQPPPADNTVYENIWKPWIKNVSHAMALFSDSGWKYHIPAIAETTIASCNIADAILLAAKMKAQARQDAIAMHTVVNLNIHLPQPKYNINDENNDWTAHIKSSWTAYHFIDNYTYKYIEDAQEEQPTVASTPAPSIE